MPNGPPKSSPGGWRKVPNVVEARIICLAPSIRIPDLNLVMVKDQEAYVDEKTARESTDLEVARRAGGVQLHWVERSRTVRIPEPAVPQRAETPRRGFKATAAERLEIDLDTLAHRVAEKMAAQHRDPDTNKKIDALLTLVGDLRREISGGVVVPGVLGGKVAEDVPVFIPEKLVNAGLGIVEVKTENSTPGAGAGLDKAAEALKALKASRKKMETQP